MSDSLQKFFIRKGIYTSSPYRICFYDDDEKGNKTVLKAIKDLSFKNQNEAIAECELQNLVWELNVYFKELPEFKVIVADPSKLWDKKVDPTRGRGIVIYAYKQLRLGIKAWIPLFCCGVGNQGFARAIEFLDKVKESRTWGFIPAPERTEPTPTVYEETLWQNICDVEGLVSDAIGNLQEALSTLRIASSKSDYKANTVGLEYFESKLKTITEILKNTLDGTNYVSHEGFSNFLETFGLARFTDKCFDDKQNEIYFFSGYEKYCNDDAKNPIEDYERAFIDKHSAAMPDENTNDESQIPTRNRDDDAEEKQAEENYISEILEHTERVQPYDGLEFNEVGAKDIDEI